MKPHPTLDNYLIGTSGGVINRKTGRLLKRNYDKSGYVYYKIGGRHRNENRLIMETYRPIENDHLYHAHHENRVRDDNRLENLKWELKAEHISKHHKGKVVSEEHKKKMSEAKMGKPNQALVGKGWWNNGVKTIRSKECPGEGWVRGRM